MQDKIIIGISGRKQAGKSTLAEYIQACDYFPHLTCIQSDDGKITIIDDDMHSEWDWYKFKIHTGTAVGFCSFADALKEFLINVMGLSYEQCYGTNEEKNSFTQYKWENLPVAITSKFEQGGVPPIGYIRARELMQIFGTNIMRRMFSDNIWVDAAIRRIQKMAEYIVVIPDVRFISEVKKIMSLDNTYIIRLSRKIFEDAHESETELDQFDFSSFGDRVLVVDNQNMSIQEKNAVVIPFLEKILS